MIVYIIGFDPIEDRAAVGGFDWFYTRESALLQFNRCALAPDDGHFVWYRSQDIPQEIGTSKDAITGFISEKLALEGANGDWV